MTQFIRWKCFSSGYLSENGIRCSKCSFISNIIKPSLFLKASIFTFSSLAAELFSCSGFMTLVTFEIMATKLLLKIHYTRLLCFYLEFWKFSQFTLTCGFFLALPIMRSQSKYLFNPYNFVTKADLKISFEIGQKTVYFSLKLIRSGSFKKAI